MKKASNPKGNAFEVIALQWWEQQKESWAKDHQVRVKFWITRDVISISAKRACKRIGKGSSLPSLTGRIAKAYASSGIRKISLKYAPAIARSFNLTFVRRSLKAT